MADSFKVRLGDTIVQTQEGFAPHPGIVAVVKAKGMPVKAQYHLGVKILKRFQQEWKDFEEKRQELVKDFGEEIVENDKPTGNFKVTDANLPAFRKALAELLDVEVNVELRTLKVSDLGEPQGTTPEDFMACSAFIEE